METPERLKQKIVIGNIKCKQSYSPDDKAFHSSDIPDHARLARIAAKSWKRPPILGVKKGPWNADSSTSGPLCTRATSQLLIPAHIRPKMEPLRDETSGGWNSATQLSSKDVEHAHTLATSKSLAHTKRVTSSLVLYRPPHVRVADGMLSASLVAKEVVGPVSPARSPAPVRSTAASSRKFKKFTHSGTYCQTRFEKTRIWSCCLSADAMAEGCVVTTVNPDAYNFASFT